MSPEQELQKIFELIGKIPCLHSFTPEDAQILARLSHLKEYKAKQAIISEGEYNHELHFLIRGAVEVSIGDQLLQSYRGGGKIFGENSFVTRSKTRATASVTAVTDVVVMTVKCDEIYNLDDNLYSHFKMNLYRSISEILCQKLLEANITARSSMMAE